MACAALSGAMIGTLARLGLLASVAWAAPSGDAVLRAATLALAAAVRCAAYSGVTAPDTVASVGLLHVVVCAALAGWSEPLVARVGAVAAVS